LDGSPSVKQRHMVTIDPKDLIGRTFLKDDNIQVPWQENICSVKVPSENSELKSLDGSPSVKRRRMVTIDPKDLIGFTFLKDSEEDGQGF
jgi:hypothetical protein